MNALNRLKKLRDRLLSRKVSLTDQTTDFSRLSLEDQARTLNSHLMPEEREAAVKEYLQNAAGRTRGVPISYAPLGDMPKTAESTFKKGDLKDMPQWFLLGELNLLKASGQTVLPNETVDAAYEQWVQIRDNPEAIARVMEYFNQHPQTAPERRTSENLLRLGEQPREFDGVDEMLRTSFPSASHVPAPDASSATHDEGGEEAARRTSSPFLPVGDRRMYGITPGRDRTIWTADNRQWPFYIQNNRFVRQSLERVMDAAEREGDVFGPDAPAFDPEYHHLAVLGPGRPTAEAAGFTERRSLNDLVRTLAAATMRPGHDNITPLTHKKGRDLRDRVLSIQRRPKKPDEHIFLDEYADTPTAQEQDGGWDAPAREGPYGAPPGRWRRFRERLKESKLGPYLAVAGIVGVAALLTLSSTCRSRHGERIEVEALHTLRPVAAQPYRPVSPDTAPVAPAPKKPSAQGEEAPLEHVVEDTYRLNVPGARTLTIDYEGGQLRYEPEGRAVAFPGPFLDYARAHPDERAVLTARTGDGDVRFTLPLDQLVGQDANDYATDRFEGSVEREHRSDGPTSLEEWYPMGPHDTGRAQPDAVEATPDTGSLPGRILVAGPAPGTLGDAQLAGLTLYRQRHRQDSLHGYMTPTEISDHLEDVYGAHVGRADFIAARRGLVADGLAAGKSLRDLARQLDFSYSTIQRDAQALRA